MLASRPMRQDLTDKNQDLADKNQALTLMRQDVNDTF